MCCVEGCDRKSQTADKCYTHYRRALRGSLSSKLVRSYVKEAKCHCGAKHYGQGLCLHHWREQRTKVSEEKLLELHGNSCGDCGLTYPFGVYDFHHLDPKTKKFEISNGRFGNLDRLIAEARKCVMLCANCHRLRHLKESQDVIR